VRDEALADAILAFERSIPTGLLGGRPRTYEHGRDYTRFFRAVGPNRTYIARDPSGAVIGTLTGVAWRVRLPSGKCRSAVYLMRIRVAFHVRTGPTIVRLMVRILLFVLFHGCAAITLVQTGRSIKQGKIARALGLPEPRPVGAVRMITWPVSSVTPEHDAGLREATEREVRDRFGALTHGRIAVLGGNPHMRSALPPRWIMAADGSACGCIEDYARALTWRDDTGAALLESHLSFFGWQDPEAGGRFFRACLSVGASMGITRLRAVVDERLADAFIRAVGVDPDSQVHWTLWAAGRARFPDAPWVLQPSEI
jgi:hypothetical protein